MKKIFFFIFLLFASHSLVNGQAVTFDWAAQMGGNLGEKGQGIVIDASGNTYVTGYFAGTVDFNPGTATFNLTATGQEDIFIVKLNASGAFSWAVHIGGAATDMGNSIAVDSDNNIYVTGYFQGTVDFDPGSATASATAVGNKDMFIVKFSSTGNWIWNKHMVATSGSLVEGRSIAVDKLGNVVTTGLLKGTVDFNPGTGTSTLSATSAEDFFVSKLTKDGNYVWAYRFGNGDITSTGNAGRSIATDSNNDVYIGGSFSKTIDFKPGAGIFNLTSSGYMDAFILKLSASGVFAWASAAGGTDNDVLTSLVVTDSLNIYSTGYFSGTADFDPGSGTVSFTALGDEDIYIAKWDAQGSYLWTKTMGSQYSDQAACIAVDPLANVYTAGYYSYTTDFDPGSGSASNPSAGSKDAFMVKLTPAGNFSWVNTINTVSNEQIQSIAVSSTGSIFTTGYFIGSPDFNPEAGTYTLTSILSSSDIFVQKLSQTLTLGVHNPHDVDAQIQLFPNPCSDNIFLQFDRTYENLNLRLIDTRGQVVQEFSNLSGENFTLDLSMYQAGFYCLEIISNAHSTTRRYISKF